MNALKLRQGIVKKLETIEDENLLSLVESFIEFESEEIFIVSKAQEKAINIGISEIESGHFISDKDLRKETDEWLRK